MNVTPVNEPFSAPPASSRDRLALIVDDEPAICWTMQRMLEEEGLRVLTAGSAEEGLKLAEAESVDLTVLDVRLPKRDGISALPDFRAITADAPVVVMTAFGDLETAVSAIQEGASDYLVKPFSLETALRVCRQALESRPAVDPLPASANAVETTPQLVGQSPAMQQAFRQIALVASSDLSVLITGETGTGKELVAAAIHRHSARCGKPYVAVAPVALNPELVESELFGHVKGAFTGAIAERPGRFEQAEGGTILLDEIGDLSPNLQVKLLRVLEQGEYARVGDVQTRRCDVRVLAATHCDLAVAVQAGQFREDLFYRLNGLHIHLPPLRHRVDDIQPLAEYFLNRLGVSPDVLTADVLKDLKQRPWWGNVRELRNAIGHAAVLARGRRLTPEDFPPPQPGRQEVPVELDSNDGLNAAVEAWIEHQLQRDDLPQEELFTRCLSLIEPPLLRAVLRSTGGSRSRAAQMLGMHRGTLREKLRSHGMDDAANLGGSQAG